MIKLAENSIMIIDSNGVMTSFEPERLQTKIIRCFLAAGIRESWLAEDIAMAVEFALEQNNREDKIFALSEINSTVVRILEDTGFPEAANVYRRGNSCSQVTFNSEQATVSKLISKHLGANSDNLDFLTSKVLDATKKLNIKTAPPTLFVELAKYYETEELPSDGLKPIALQKWEQASPWLVDMENIYENLKPSTKNLVDARVIRLSGISRLFPSIKLFFMINEFVHYHDLEAPLTEMILIPYLYSAGQALEDCIQNSLQLFDKDVQENRPPVFLTIPDMSGFAVEMLQASWPEAESDCRDMLTPLCQSLSTPLFKLKFN
jgi:hypothetical protein